jgi:hypothetical protein
MEVVLIKAGALVARQRWVKAVPASQLLDLRWQSAIYRAEPDYSDYRLRNNELLSSASEPCSTAIFRLL